MLIGDQSIEFSLSNMSEWWVPEVMCQGGCLHDKRVKTAGVRRNPSSSWLREERVRQFLD
jgi:hypothetical protein